MKIKVLSVFGTRPEALKMAPILKNLDQNPDNITLLPPLDYQSLVHLMSRSYLVLTDSGGIQEEAPCFGKPVLVLRNTTERQEGIDIGIAKLVGTNKQRIVKETASLLDDSETYQATTCADNPYGDGYAGERIVKALFDY